MAEENNGTQQQNNSEGGQQQNNQQNNGNQSQQRNTGTTFTQDDLNRIGATEKAAGRRSILSELGFEDAESAKSEYAKYKEWLSTQKTEAEKTAESLSVAEQAKTEAEKKAQHLENKFTALSKKVNSDSVEDALIIAYTKVTDSKALDSVLDDMAKEGKYKAFFDMSDTQENNKAKGTGNPIGGRTTTTGNESIGSRLAKQRVGSAQGKSAFFSN